MADIVVMDAIVSGRRRLAVLARHGLDPERRVDLDRLRGADRRRSGVGEDRGVGGTAGERL